MAGVTTECKAILMGKDGFVSIVDVPYPPPPSWHVPRARRINITDSVDGDVTAPPPPHREFRLDLRWRALDLKWRLETRQFAGVTLENGYVYFER